MAAWGKLIGAVIGVFVMERAPPAARILGAIIGAVIGHFLIDAPARRRTTGAAAMPVAELFFRTTFELMGRVAKADGRVSPAEIDAARRYMQEMQLDAARTALAIECFRAGKSTTYDVDRAVERLRDACGTRHDLLRAFVEVQLRTALAGNDISPPARAALGRVAEQLGMSGLEFARMESLLRARTQRPAGARNLADYYAELEVEPTASDQDVVNAYRRQMSRHHPDKLVANGLPESMAQVAKAKAQRIQEAYAAIRAARGMR